MRRKQLLLKVDALLKDYQFRHFDSVWNREYSDFVDVIDIQMGKSRETFTVNIGVAEKSILDLCWGSDEACVVDEPSCTVRVRLGILMRGRDIWWSLLDDGSIDEVLHEIENVAIPFLQRNHSIDQMIASLEANPSARRYPPEAIYLALLYDRRGESDRSREMLEALHSKYTGSWRQKVSEILRALN